MSAGLSVLILAIGCYLIGAVPFGLLVARARGVDIRTQGSGNIGATNVGRVMGRKWGALVFLLDAGKGALCTVVAGWLAARMSEQGNGAFAASPASAPQDLFWLAAAAAAVLGNVFPIYLGFKGGKGVATALGAILGIYPYLTFAGLGVGLIWVVVVAATRYVSLGSILAAIALPIVFAGLSNVRGWDLRGHLPLLGLCCLLAVVVLLRHRDNVRRLLSGAENKFGVKKP